LDTKLAVIGCGIWGKNLVRNFYHLGALFAVCDTDAELLNEIAREYTNVICTDKLDNILKDKDIDGVVVATPSHTHYAIAKKALLAGKNVYVEKPLATSAQEAMELNELALQKGLVLMVGHLLLYHPAVNRLKSLIKQDVLGEITYVQSDRLNVNYFRNDRSVMWDLAPHDISMVTYVTNSKPVKITSAVGYASGNDKVIDIVHIDIEYDNNFSAHISSSWIHPEKRVLLMVKGTKATAILDDTAAANKLHLYDNSSASVNTVDYPEYIDIEPLKLECQHLITCIQKGIKSRSDGENGYETVKLLEEAEKIIMKNAGGNIKLLNPLSSRKKRPTSPADKK
jgi:UDP-2-acetamido-3-amino-2,3-dideoxy-glucuronate N-acetyltransferase